MHNGGAARGEVIDRMAVAHISGVFLLLLPLLPLRFSSHGFQCSAVKGGGSVMGFRQQIREGFGRFGVRGAGGGRQRDASEVDCET